MNCVCGHHELAHHAGGCELAAEICGCTLFEPDDGHRTTLTAVEAPTGHTPYDGRYSRLRTHHTGIA